MSARQSMNKFKKKLSLLIACILTLSCMTVGFVSANANTLSPEKSDVTDEVIPDTSTPSSNPSSSGGGISGGNNPGGGGSSGPAVGPPSDPPEPEWENPYIDVNESSWFYDAVQYVSMNGLMNGTSATTFSPNATMNRALMVTILYRMDGVPDVSGEIPFTDIPNGTLYTEAVLWASQNGIVYDYYNGNFGANEPVTREWLMTIFYNYTNYLDIDVGAVRDFPQFTDIDDISDWALNAVEWAVETQLINGYVDNTFRPHNTITRAEIAVLLQRYINDSLFRYITYYYSWFDLYYNGQYQMLETPLLVTDNEYLAPVQAVSEVFRLDAFWDSGLQQLTLKDNNNGNELILSIKSKTYLFNDVPFNFDISPRMVSGRIYIPLRLVAEKFGYNYFVDEIIGGVHIYQGEQESMYVKLALVLTIDYGIIGPSYTANIVYLDGRVFTVDTTEAMFTNRAAYEGKVCSFDGNASGYVFSAPNASLEYFVDDGITRIERGSIQLYGAKIVTLASNTTKFAVVNYKDGVPDGTVNIYIGRNGIPDFGDLTVGKTIAVSYNAENQADQVAEIVFIYENIYNSQPHEWINPYIDVNMEAWYYEAVKYVTVNGLMNGISETLFSPNSYMTRVMMVTDLYHIEGNPAVVGESQFLDIESGQWYSNAIIWARQNGIIGDYYNGYFGVDEPATREWISTVFYNYAYYKGKDVSKLSNLSQFTDVNDISRWALNATKWGVEVGITLGYVDGSLRPQSFITRAEVAALFTRYNEKILNATNSEPDVRNGSPNTSTVTPEIIDPEPPLVPLTEAASYDDVSATDWYYDAVVYTSGKKLMTGTGNNKFSPNIPMSRAMLVTVLYRLEGEPAIDSQSLNSDSLFNDIVKGSWYYNAVIWAAENGIVDGYGNGLFGINDPVTREQTVAILYRYAKTKGLDFSATGDLSGFVDADYVSSWALEAIQWAVAEGIIKGLPGNRIAPQGTSTRAEIATIFMRYIEGLLDN